MENLIKRIAAISLLAAMLMSCNGNSRKVNRLVSELNSEAMQQAERATGLFTGSEAKLCGDTILLTLNLVEGLSLAGADVRQIPVLRQSAVAEFRDKMSDENVAEGLEAMKAEGKVLKIRWLDSDGVSVEIVIDPAEIVER